MFATDCRRNVRTNLRCIVITRGCFQTTRSFSRFWRHVRHASRGHMNIASEAIGRRASWFAAFMCTLSCLIFAAAVWFGPAQQHEGIQLAFVAVIMADILAVILFATARLAFSFMLTGILFLTLSAV